MAETLETEIVLTGGGLAAAMADIARETFHYQSMMMNLEFRRLGLAILRSFGFKGVGLTMAEDRIMNDAIAAERWADDQNEQAACPRCQTTPERHEEHSFMRTGIRGVG